jgi:hypothetical protein
MSRGNDRAEAAGIDLLRARAVRAFVRWRGFPAVLQIPVLAVFLALAVLGWGELTPEGVPPKLFAKTNLVTLAIWGLWWPAIVWATVLLGRAWCVVCPLEWVSGRAEALGGVLGIRRRRLPGWMAKGSLVILLFALLQMLVPGVQIHRVPHTTSIFLWTSLAVAFAAGLFLRDRAFCRGFCPVALLLNAYGRGGMLAVRPAPGAGRAAPDAKVCRSLLGPARLDTNRYCILCGDCIKADASGAMQWRLRVPFAADDVREPVASWPLTLFVMTVSGFVTYELCGVWKAADAVFAWVPQRVAGALGAGAAAGWIRGLWTIVVVPALLWLAVGALARAVGVGRGLADAWRRLALPMAVVVAAGHMAKGLEKVQSWAGFLPHAWAEPGGVQTALAMNAKTMAQPAAWMSPQALSGVSLTLIILASGLALREARRADPSTGRRLAAPILLLGGFYVFLVFGWGGWI